MITALVLTYNEENIIGQCLTALGFTDHIFVFDSFSSDRTENIAIEHNATVIKRPFDNYASQRNAALAQIPVEFDWILMVDADEIVTPELKAEILRVISRESDITMYRVRRKDMFQDQWIKQSSGYPTWFPRLFKNGTVTVKREINEEYTTDGVEGKLQEHLIHYPFNKGMDYWYEKHRNYAKMEAERMLEETSLNIPFGDLFSRDPVKRRKAQKLLSYKLPFRPQLIFFALYFLRRGFLNGKAGYRFCKLRQQYETMIADEYKKLKNKTYSSSL